MTWPDSAMWALGVCSFLDSLKWKGRTDWSVLLHMPFLFLGCQWVLGVYKPTLKALEQSNRKMRGPWEMLASWSFFICPGLPATVLLPKKKFICLLNYLHLGLVLWSQIELLANEMVIACFLYARICNMPTNSVRIWHALFCLILTHQMRCSFLLKTSKEK